MNTLRPGQSLRVEERLQSTNGWFETTLRRDGTVTVTRVLGQLPVWSSGVPSSQPDMLAMHLDGDLIAFAAGSNPYWRTGTSGHPNASLVMQNDGDLQVLEAQGRQVWHTNTANDLLLPTVRYFDANNRRVNETSESWKERCSALPCSLALQWPQYSTTVIPDTIAGQNVVIQLWKGWCPKFLGSSAFPGGIGAEVGIYRQRPVRAPPASFLPDFAAPYVQKLFDSIAAGIEGAIWWPFPELGTTLTFKLCHPGTRDVFIEAGPETSYWLAKWMEDASYLTYAQSRGAPPPKFYPIYPVNDGVPANADGYDLYFTVNGKTYPVWGRGTRAQEASYTSSLLLLG